MSILGDLVKMYQLWGSWQDQHLTDPEKELLVKADARSGIIIVFPGTKDQAEHVVVGDQEFDVPSDPAVRARALESLEKLSRRGLVRHEGGIRFCLTGSGFEKAREIKVSSAPE